MKAPERFVAALEVAFTAPDPVLAIRQLAADDLAKGTSRQDLLDWLQGARALYPAREDDILDAMDIVHGWCSPHLLIRSPNDPRHDLPPTAPDGVALPKDTTAP